MTTRAQTRAAKSGTMLSWLRVGATLTSLVAVYMIPEPALGLIVAGLMLIAIIPGMPPLHIRPFPRWRR